MKLTEVAHNAAEEIKEAIDSVLSEEEVKKITAIIAKAMEKSVKKVSKRNIEISAQHLNPDTDIAHQIQHEIKRKQETIITNLSSLR